MRGVFRKIIKSQIILAVAIIIIASVFSVLHVKHNVASNGIAIISIAQAVDVGVEIPGGKSGGKGYTYQSYIADVYKFALTLGEWLAVLMIVYAGYKYMTSQGNSSAINDAKEMLIGALLGLAILFLVRVILNTLNLPNPADQGASTTASTPANTGAATNTTQPKSK